MHRLILAGWLMGCALLGACTSLSHREGIDLSLVNLRLREATIWETTAEFTLRINNETPEPLALEGGVHKFYLDGQYIGEGLTNERIEVPRLNSVTQAVTVHLGNLAMARRIRSIVESRGVGYKVRSTLYAAANGRTQRFSVSHEGSLSAKDFQPNLRDTNPSP